MEKEQRFCQSCGMPLADVNATSAALGIAFKPALMLCSRWHELSVGSKRLRAKTAVFSIIGREVSPPDYVYAQNVECEEPCEGRLSRTVL